MYAYKEICTLEILNTLKYKFQNRPKLFHHLKVKFSEFKKFLNII